MIGAITAGLFSTPTAPVTNSYESIATYSGGSTSVTLSSIPSTYKHLQLRVFAKDSNGGGTGNVMQIRLNSDTGSNYAYHDIEANGSSVSAYGISTQTIIYGSVIASNGSGASVYGTQIIDLLDYANTNKTKTLRIMGAYDNNGSGEIRYGSGLWNSTSAVTSITLTLNGGDTFSSGSQFSLYGIKG